MKNKMHEVVGKMLDVLGLRIAKKHIGYDIPYVTKDDTRVVRVFRDKNGRFLQWTRPIICSKAFPMGKGTWTVFRDGNEATYELFTSIIEHFSLVASTESSYYSERTVINPFYGCKSIEEVLIKCDLLIGMPNGIAI